MECQAVRGRVTVEVTVGTIIASAHRAMEAAAFTRNGTKALRPRRSQIVIAVEQVFQVIV